MELVELPVEAAVGEELLVGALLAELALVHDENGVGALDGGEAVGDQDTRPALHHSLQGGADAEFGFGVDAAGGFVEDQNAGIVGQGAGEVDELLLARGEGTAALADGLVEARRKTIYKFQNIDVLGGS